MLFEWVLVHHYLKMKKFILLQREAFMNNKVLYKGQVFTILFRYETGYCEIRAIMNPFKVMLVHCSELTKVQNSHVYNHLI